MGSADPPEKMDEKIKSKKHAQKNSFLCLCYILRAIRAGRCRERRYADHIFIQMYFTMHQFVVKFSKKFLRLGRQGVIDPPNQNPADVPGHRELLFANRSSVQFVCCGRSFKVRSGPMSGGGGKVSTFIYWGGAAATVTRKGDVDRCLVA